MTTNIVSLATHAARYIADDLNSPDGVPFKDLAGFISTIVSSIGLPKSERNKIGFTHIPSGDASIAMNGMQVEAYVSIWYRHHEGTKIELVIPASNSNDLPTVWGHPSNSKRLVLPVGEGNSAANHFVDMVNLVRELSV